MKTELQAYGYQTVAALCLLLLVGTLQAEDAPEPERLGPYDVVANAANELQRNLDGKQDYYSENSAELYKLIDSVLLPSFDVQQAGKLVLGKQHWFAASEDQRQRFITAFYDFLVKTYAEGILGFEQNKIQIKPEPAFSRDKRKALVGTELALANGDAVEVNYALREVDAVWKIYDVRIDGVSYVQNYRNQFGAEISALGLEAVIERLESGA
jgi:phospholipid transport system substrate-binding protein